MAIGFGDDLPGYFCCCCSFCLPGHCHFDESRPVTQWTFYNQDFSNYFLMDKLILNTLAKTPLGNIVCVCVVCLHI